MRLGVKPGAHAPGPANSCRAMGPNALLKRYSKIEKAVRMGAEGKKGGKEKKEKEKRSNPSAVQMRENPSRFRCASPGANKSGLTGNRRRGKRLERDAEIHEASCPLRGLRPCRGESFVVPENAVRGCESADPYKYSASVSYS